VLFQSPRGTTDILPQDQRHWRYVEETARAVASRFGYEQITTPIFEDTALFARGIGSSTDILEKETYTFADRGGDSMTLRPEGTAPVCRAYLQHGMHNLPQPVRLFYLVPNFRYERPQSGRYRAFNQFGVEVIGEHDPYIDAEVIEIAWIYLQELGLKNLSLTVNSIGDPLCRPAYVEHLKTYYQPQVAKVCEDCSRRINTNPLRLLDCKNEPCQELIENAPKSIEMLCQPCEGHWNSLIANLEKLGLEYEVENKLVRGLDYYTRTVFEISPPDEGRTSVIAGGGRYDGLLEELGGNHTPGIGFGMGIERVIENMRRQNTIPNYQEARLIMVAHIGNKAKQEAIKLSSEIRSNGGTSLVGPSRGLRSQLRYASHIKATEVVIIGDEEIQNGSFPVRNLGNSDQSNFSKADIIKMFAGT
jgi:histidyl-tRNA synthetase